MSICIKDQIQNMNLVIGCTVGCAYCYARNNVKRWHNDLRELLRQTITVAMQGMALQPVEKKAEISENDLAALDFINSL